MHSTSIAIYFLSRVLGAALFGGAAFALSLWAMRPYGPLSAVLNTTYPELVFALCVAMLVFVVATWRLFRAGSSVKAEAGKLANAAFGDDHLG